MTKNCANPQGEKSETEGSIAMLFEGQPSPGQVSQQVCQKTAQYPIKRRKKNKGLRIEL